MSHNQDGTYPTRRPPTWEEIREAKAQAVKQLTDQADALEDILMARVNGGTHEFTKAREALALFRFWAKEAISVDRFIGPEACSG